MENKPLLSICIPTYNRANFLKECLDSIFNQKGFNEKEIEIIISDNASKDNTTNIVESYQKKIKNIKYYRNKSNLGARNNINILLNIAKGKRITIISDDDFIENNFIYEIYKKIKLTDKGLILICKNYSNEYNIKKGFEKILSGEISVEGISGFIFKNRNHYKLKDYNNGFLIDTYLLLLLIIENKGFSIINKYIYNRRIWDLQESNFSNGNYINYIKAFIKFDKDLNKLFIKEDFNIKYYFPIKNIILQIIPRDNIKYIDLLKLKNDMLNSKYILYLLILIFCSIFINKYTLTIRKKLYIFYSRIKNNAIN